MDKFPRNKIKRQRIIKKTSNNMPELDLLPLKLESVGISGNNEPLAILTAEEKRIAFIINNMESTMLVFFHSGCSDCKITNTVYDLYIMLLKENQTTIESTTIETKKGDLFFARICLNNNGRKIYIKSSVGDAIVLASMSGAKLQIIRQVLDEMDEFEMQYFEESDYEQFEGDEE